MTPEAGMRERAVRRLARGLPVHRVIDMTRPGAWTDLDEDVRRAHRHGTPAPSRWPTLLALVTGARVGEARLAAALCAPDGRVREAALGRAATVPALLPLVAIRTADWVGPVRERACAVLAAALPGSGPETLSVTAPVILRIADRMRGGEAARLLDETLGRCPESTVTALTYHRDRPTRRLARWAAMARNVYGPRELATLAAYDPDIVVQDRAAAAAVAADAPDETLPVLLVARSGRVRAAGVTGLRRAGRSREAEPFLYDRSAMVRACARWVLRQEGTDPLSLYRAACADPSGMPDRAPLGLAECGERSVDVPVLWELTGHGSPLARASAVAGLRLFDIADRDRLMPLLADPAPGVVRETALALRPWAGWLPEAELLALAGAERPRHVRVRARQLLAAAGRAVPERG
ncbi:hypothetical protein ACGFMM_20605 [Streptomyces sp. NPDC048604]|uniref:hypothetical protein n=1 Tax=Streptomyces sp. NPDC048604 TaxID=3365578 RepID=UPI0037236D0C